MKRSTFALSAGAVLVLSSAAGAQEEEPRGAQSETPPALVHLRHVSDTFRGTPDQRGILPTAVAETEIAVRHASLALGDTADLEAMQRHAGHVLHALDPSQLEDGGPGLGYGAIRAAERAAHYIALASAARGATPPLQTHAEHVETAARNAVVNGTAAAELAQEILEAEETQVAAELVSELLERASAMLEGIDADGDGRIGWQEGEGGLAQAEIHLGLLRRAVGLEGSPP